MHSQPDFAEAGISAEVLERRAENRNPAQHSGVCYFRGTVQDAIAQAQRTHSLLIVLLKGEDSQSLLADERLHALLLAKPFKAIALRLHDDLSNADPKAFSTAKAFREYYPATVLPVLHVLDPTKGKSVSMLEGPAVAAEVDQLISGLRLKAESKAQARASSSSGGATASEGLQQPAQSAATDVASADGMTARAASPLRQSQTSASALEDSAKEWHTSHAAAQLASKQDDTCAPQVEGPAAPVLEDDKRMTEAQSTASALESIPSDTSNRMPLQTAEGTLPSAPLSAPDTCPLAGGVVDSNLGSGPVAAESAQSSDTVTSIASTETDSLTPASERQKRNQLPLLPPASPPRASTSSRLLRTDVKPPTVGLDQITPSKGKPKPEEVGKMTFQALKQQLVFLQFRLTDGSVLRAEFPVSTQLADIVAYVDRHRTDGRAPYTLSVPFPRRTLDADVLGKTLLELDLVPRSTLVLQPDLTVSRSSIGVFRSGAAGRAILQRIGAIPVALLVAIASFLAHLNPFNAPRKEAPAENAQPSSRQSRRRESDPTSSAATSYQGGSVTPASLRQRRQKEKDNESSDSD